MILYRPIALKPDEECDFSYTPHYLAAKELGKEYYPSGYEIEEIDTDDVEVDG